MVQKIAAFVLGAVIRTLLDRIAFGSTGAKELYHSLPGVAKLQHALHEELPSRHTETGSHGHSNVVFVGELDDRKGILDVMASWPSVEAEVPGSVVTVIGGGEHADKVSAWCAERPSSRHFLGFLAHDDVKGALIRADVLVAPSRRSGRWREQIGLPIGEALARGLTIVTTDETGLAKWLANNGHVVISETMVADTLAGAIAVALKTQRAPATVQNSLPAVPGRIAADKWLHTQLLP
ncbi:glycosyltransferase involved in cell wall biosynthesis [Pseudarthrobacter sulfonivorans]|nr:glycosyltransferase involved in cell wall biosynthesis [Pseudarthrobacter sulfonivorans]